METEELIKLVDGIYKNILDKFNPGARQMINAGKAYLKALHGAAAASRLYVDAVNKLAKQAQQGTWGGCSDIGASLNRIVEVYREIQDQQMNILKAFYVDLLVPLETNLEKDTKVVQSEQRRFLQQHKQRTDTYTKAAAMMKKQRKKSRSNPKSSSLAMDKELKNMQALEEEKTKLDAFCEQSLKNAMTQERRRYGFVLERHCSLTKHYLSYHNFSGTILQQSLDKWSEVAKTREFLPDNLENIFTNKLRQISVWQDEDVYSNPRSPTAQHIDSDRVSIASQLRKTKSMDASCLDIRSMAQVGSPTATLLRAKSEYHLNTSTHSLDEIEETPTRRPKSATTGPATAAPQVPPPPPTWDTQLVRALYAYLSSGENQLSFLEGDLILLIGDRNKGWQFGENLRTQISGWFPLAYTEMLDDSNSPSHRSSGSGSGSGSGGHSNTLTTSGSTVIAPPHSTAPAVGPGAGSGIGPASSSPGAAGIGGGNNHSTHAHIDVPGARMFGDTLHLHRSSANAKQIRRAIGSNNIPPPALPAPIPSPSIPYPTHQQRPQHSHQHSHQHSQHKLQSALPQSQSSSFSNASSTVNHTYSMKHSSTANDLAATDATPNYSTHPQPSRSDRPSATAATASASASTLPSSGAPMGKLAAGQIGNLSLHSSNDSGFSNDPPPQPEVDYSDDESLDHNPNPATSKVAPRRKSRGVKPRRETNNGHSDTMNIVKSRKLLPLRNSNSSTDLMETRNYVSDDSGLVGQRKLVKRTKSFWRFGKSNSENEILEGMSLWRHRDLVDVEDTITPDTVAKDAAYARSSRPRHAASQAVESRKASRDTSNDSERTIHVHHQRGGEPPVNSAASSVQDKRNKSQSAKSHQRMTATRTQETYTTAATPKPLMRKSKPSSNNRFYNNNNNNHHHQHHQDEYDYDDGGGDDDAEDGLLMMRTVNRKDILKQYATNEELGDDGGSLATGSESEMTSEDPYDSIVVSDQTQKMRQHQHQHQQHSGHNVAAIGKKLEKLSKNIKHPSALGNSRDGTSNRPIPVPIPVPVPQQRQHQRQHQDRARISDRKYRSEESKNSSNTRMTRSHSANVEMHNSENGEQEHEDDVGQLLPALLQQQKNQQTYNESKERKVRQEQGFSTRSEISEISEMHLANSYRPVVDHDQADAENHHRLKRYYNRHRDSTTTADEFSDVTDVTERGGGDVGGDAGGRRYPTARSKGGKGADSKYETDNAASVLNYDRRKGAAGAAGAAAQTRLSSRRTDRTDRQENIPADPRDASHYSGNMYGPWYDLWGLDASVQK